MIARIEIGFDSEDKAKQIMHAINPDNSPLPTGLSITTKVENKNLMIQIECSRGIDSLRATVEDIMSAVDLSIRTYDLVST
ncbi:MAG: KEOPS complex subunit Pcc1 [Candidatus Thorarchaeota archaeon]